MTRNTIATIAATLLAATTFSGLAEAGNGVRLSFGGPLGSFVAHPVGGGSAYGTGASYGAKKHCAQKVQTARQVSEPRPKRQVASASSQRRVVADDAKSSGSSGASKSKTQVASIDRDEETTATETVENTLTGSKALAAQDAQPAETKAETIETGSSAEAADASTEATAANGDKTGEQKDGETKKEEATKTAEARDVGCKKFIPAIGVTVSVGCNK